MTLRGYKGATAPTTLALGVTSGATSLTATDISTWAGIDAAPFSVTINRGRANEEQILVTTINAGTGVLSPVTRGYAGSTAVAHYAGETIEVTSTYLDFQEANAHINTSSLDQHTQYAKIPVAADTIRYVSAAGNDSNNGLSWGRAKLTVEGAIASLTGRTGTVHIGAGTFALGATTLYVTTDGTTAGDPAKLRLIGQGSDQTIITYTGTGAAISSGTSTNTPGGALVLADLAVSGSGASGNARGIYLKRYQQATTLTRVKVTGFPFANVHFYRCYGIGLYSCHFTGGGGWGALFDDSNGFYAADTRFSSNTSGGARVFYNGGGAPYDESGTASAAGTFMACLAEDNTGPGLSIESSSMIDVIGGYIENNGGDGQIIVTGAAAASVSFARLAGVRFNGNSASARAVYVDYGEVNLEGNQSFAHVIAFCEVTANGTVHWGSGHRNGTRPEGTDGDPAVLIDGSRQTKNAQRSSFSGTAIPFSLMFLLDDPAAAVTNGDVPLNNSPLATNRMDPAGMSWEIQYITARATGAPSAGAHSAAFTADAGTDTLTSVAHGMSNGTVIAVSSSTSLPGGLSASTIYYVIGATADTFQVSLSSGGSAVNITGAGTGTHTYFSSLIAFFPKSGTTALNAAMEAVLYNTVPFVGQVGNARSAVVGGVIGLGYTTSAEYAASAGTKYLIVVSGVLKPFAS